MRPFCSFGAARLGVALAGTALIALLSFHAPANAQCAPPAGAGTPAPGTTVTCTGAVTAQNPPNGYGDGSQNGLAINVATGASVSGSGSSQSGIAVNNNDTINNSGTITGTAILLSTANGIRAGSGLTVINNAGATIQGVLVSGIANGISASDATVTNSGTISGGTTGIFATIGGATITNNVGAIIQSGGDAVIATTNANVTNAGSISGGTVAIVANTGTATVTNNGTIGGGSVGILANSGTANVTNNTAASIQGSNAGVYATTGAVVVNAGAIASTAAGSEAVNVISGVANVTNANSGVIEGVGANGFGVFAGSNSGAVVNNSGTIGETATGGTAIAVTTGFITLTNSGTISARGTNGVGASVNGDLNVTNTSTGTIIADGTGGVALTTSVLALTNYGTITGSSAAVALGGNSTVFNAGTITGLGGTAIFFSGPRPNTLTLAPTSVINGNVVGAGADTFQLGGASGLGTFDVGQIGPAAQYRGFANFAKIDNSSWTLTGSNAGAQPWSVQQGALNVASGAALPNSPFNVTGGTLSVDGTVGAVTVNGGTLMGNGTMGALAVNNGGVVAPGHSIGQLTVNGNASFAPGSVYQAEVNAAGQSDKIVATGTATLAGGTVQAIVLPGNYTPPSTYTILSAAGGRSGTFSGVISSAPYLNASLSYDPNDVFLTLTRNTTLFESQALTRNQRAVAGALDQFPLGNSLFLAAAGLSGTPAMQQALNVLSGDIHGSVQTVMLDDSRYLREAVLGRLRQGDYAGARGPLAVLGSGGPALAYADGSSAAADSGVAREDQPTTLAYADDNRPAFPIKAPPFREAPGPELAYWAQGVGSWGRIGSDGNASAASRDLAGFFTGFDRRFGDWRAGLAGGYTDSSVSASASSANINSAHLAAYAGASYGAWNVRTGAGASFAHSDTSRSIAFPGFIDAASARHDDNLEQIFAEIGYGMALGRFAAEPFAGLAYVHLRADGFSETGGGAALAGAAANDNIGYSTLGARLATSTALANGMVLIPRVSAAWQHAFGSVTPTTALTFEATGIGFTVAGVPLARDAALVDAGMDLHLNTRATLGLGYTGELSGRVHDHSVNGTFDWKF